MASYTTNLNLKKPAGSENVAIGDINNNMDTIDTAYGTLNSNTTREVSLTGIGTCVLNKVNRTVEMVYTGNASNVPAGSSGTIGTIPEGFRPLNAHYFLIQMVDNNLPVAMYVETNGTVALYNYGSAITSAKAFRISATWIS